LQKGKQDFFLKKHQLMKYLILTSAILCSFLCSCNNQDQESNETATSTDSTTESSSPNATSNNTDTVQLANAKETKSEKTQTGPSTPVDISDASFDNMVLKSDKVVVVDFWAAWCGPCKMIAPYMKDLASEYSGKIIVGKLDVDKNKITAQKYQISAIPIVMIFKNGQMVEKIVGALPKSEYKAKIDKVLGS
jgi:thioredoxin 1